MKSLRTLALVACLFAPFALAQTGAAPFTVDEIMAAMRDTGQPTEMSRPIAIHLGIPLRTNEPNIAAKARAFSFADGSLRMVIVPADLQRQYLVLMQRKGSVTRYYVTTPTGQLRKAVVNNAADGSVQYLSGSDVERSFRDELEYWEQQFPRTKP
ncbi:MAG TPA: hypothetical protein VIV54_14555 [Burkholderiales bacterium]